MSSSCAPKGSTACKVELSELVERAVFCYPPVPSLEFILLEQSWRVNFITTSSASDLVMAFSTLVRILEYV